MELRSRTTPERFCDWVYLHSEVPEDDNEEEYDLSEDYPTTSVSRLIDLAEEKYVQMYHYCEQAYLPLLQLHHNGLVSLFEICSLDASYGDEDDEYNEDE